MYTRRAERVDLEALKHAQPIQEVVTRYGIELRRQGPQPLGGVRSTRMAAGPTFIYGRTLVHGGASGATSEVTSVGGGIICTGFGKIR
jgi:hypothetical protein